METQVMFGGEWELERPTDAEILSEVYRLARSQSELAQSLINPRAKAAVLDFIGQAGREAHAWQQALEKRNGQ